MERNLVKVNSVLSLALQFFVFATIFATTVVVGLDS
jgi:hypothetical protein